MKNILKTLTICSLLATSACGIFKTRERDEAAVQNIKRIAVVAFAVSQPASAKLGFDLSKGKLGATSGGSMLDQSSQHVDQLYSELGQNFQKNMNWTVMKTEQMKANAGYKKAYKDTMEGWQNKFPPAEGSNKFVVKDIMDGDALRILGLEGRDALIDALGVDAIVTAQVVGGISSTSVMGIGNRYPYANLNFFVYTKGKEKAVWFEGQIEGEPSTESVGKTGFIDETKLNELVLKSARTAYAKIGQTKVE
jgi:hypothetical protein